jgi:hypothetical protein
MAIINFIGYPGAIVMADIVTAVAGIITTTEVFVAGIIIIDLPMAGITDLLEARIIVAGPFVARIIITDLLVVAFTAAFTAAYAVAFAVAFTGAFIEATAATYKVAHTKESAFLEANTIH